MDKSGTRKQAGPSRKSSFQYIARAERLIDRFETEQSLPWRESQSEFIAWLRESVYPALAQASRAQLRASLLHYYRRVGLSPHQIPYASDATIPKLKRTAVTRRGNTSAGRKKGIREQGWRALIQTLAGDPSVYAQIAGAMLVASRAFGLRPSEWFDERTRFVDGEWPLAMLQAANGKYREGEGGESTRSFGPTRTLIASVGDGGVQPNEVEAVRFAIPRVRGWTFELADQRGIETDQARDQVIRSLAQRIQSARKKARVKDKITLYSARHQFAADAKVAGLSKAEIAALMGHRSLETADEHYGRRSAGWGGDPDRVIGFRAVPALKDVRSVQSLNLSIEEALTGPKVPGIRLWAPAF